MNIIVTEMQFGKWDSAETIEATGEIKPDYTKFNMDKIYESRAAHENWKMGFSINDKIEGKDLIQEILAESRSYLLYDRKNRLSFMTIKDKYTFEDIKTVVNEYDIMGYKFTRTKREDLITSCLMKFRFNGAEDDFREYTDTLKAVDYFTNWSGFEYYNIDPVDTHKDIELKYHVDQNTAYEYQKFVLMNNMNMHNICKLQLPLKYINLEVGDVIKLPLIKNTLLYGEDYTKMQQRNGQWIYPAWLITGLEIKKDRVVVTAYQLHYLVTDSEFYNDEHGWDEAGTEPPIKYGSMTEYSDIVDMQGNFLPNLSYDSNAEADNNVLTVPMDLSGFGTIDAVDLTQLINIVLNRDTLSVNEKRILCTYDVLNGEYYAEDDPNKDIVNMIDIVNMVNLIWENADE